MNELKLVTIDELVVGTILKLDQKQLTDYMNTMIDANQCWECYSDFGPTMCMYNNMGLLIRSRDYDKRFGDCCMYYELFLTSKNVLIRFNERLVIDNIGEITVTLKSLDDPEVSFWLSKEEFDKIDFKYVGEID